METTLNSSQRCLIIIDKFRDERRRPAYVVENGKSLDRIEAAPSTRRELKLPPPNKSKAA
jgi:hypothetical protein